VDSRRCLRADRLWPTDLSITTFDLASRNGSCPLSKPAMSRSGYKEIAQHIPTSGWPYRRTTEE
jgi:hypothetical protein